ncbi:acyltransferase family protein [Enterococcus sp. BWR-S5]|uniref:acyltransferase family protein n=1 Tax=Enterococcus sp. BWR-S5 TaxID=2787714 RepID=UPI0019240140|nr:acyltransferase family protein [Enterococcus sp. BWR-S5]MBL1225312.1 acetyltransferase [Enterococcus sp. BWR-S5]
MEHKKRLEKSRYITGFDGIRTIAVVGVILYHLFPQIMSGGYLGVPIFFTLSGYLITDLLRQEWLQNDEIDVKGFYIRRMKRLYPGLVFMLISSSAYIALFQRDLLNNLRGVVASSVLYYNNWWQIFHGFSYFDRFAAQSPFTHIWSLAVEAQNYLIWPLIFILLKKYLKSPGKIVGAILAAAVASGLLMAVLYVPGADPTRVYYGTDTRIFSILIGSALAFVWPTFRLKEEIPEKARLLLNGVGGVSLVLIVLSFIFLSDRFTFVYRGGMFLLSIVTALLVAVTAHPGADMNKWLTNPVFTWVGKRSYGIYLYQFPVMIFYEAKITNLTDHIFLHSLVELALILGISELSYRFVEKPLKNFYYRYILYALKDVVKKPFITIPKVTFAVGVLLFGVAAYGWVVAPTNYVTADQLQLQETIEKNKKQAEERRKAEMEQAETSESTSASSEEPVGDPAHYGLTDEEWAQAQALEVTAFGDSVVLDGGADLQTVFPKMIIDGEVGRQVYNSEEALEKLKTDNQLKNTVLMSLGTNGSFTEAQFDSLMQLIGNERQVFWINVRVPTRRWQNEVNAMLNTMTEKYKNLTLIDWYGFSKDHDEWFYEDLVHPNVDGQVQYAQFIAKSLINGVNAEKKEEN